MSATGALVADAPLGAQLNPKQIDMLKGLRNGALLPQLLKTYRDDARTQIDKIRVAIGANDIAAIVSSTHSLKSASFSIGADSIGQLCASMEAAARKGDLPDGSELGERLGSLYAALLPELEKHLSP